MSPVKFKKPQVDRLTAKIRKQWTPAERQLRSLIAATEQAKLLAMLILREVKQESSRQPQRKVAC